MNKKTETGEQQAVIEWCEIMSKRWPELRTIYHIPNEGKRSRAQGKELRDAGLKAGVPDLCLPVSRGGSNALYIEMKKDRSCRCTKEQLEFQNALVRSGNCCCICYGAEDAINAIRRYMNSDINEAVEAIKELARAFNEMIKTPAGKKMIDSICEDKND